MATFQETVDELNVGQSKINELKDKKSNIIES